MSNINLPEINWRSEELKLYIENFNLDKEIKELDIIIEMRNYYEKINKEEITLTLKKRGNLLNGIVCNEQIDKLKLNKLMDSDLLRKDFRYENIGKIYESEKDLLIKYMKNMDKNGKVKVIYKKSNPYGRSNAEHHLGLQMIRREIRQTISKDYYNDIDIDNCHPQILIQICRLNNINLKYIEDYVNNRDKILEDICKEYNIKRDDAKILVLRLMFSGSFEYWKNDQLDILNNKYEEIMKDIENNNELDKLEDDKKKEREFINKFEELEILKNISKDINSISKTIYNTNEDIINEKIKKNKKDKNNKKLIKHSSVLSSFLQEIESRLLETIYEYLSYKKIIIENDCVLCADGLMIKKDKYYPELLSELHYLIKYKYNLDLNFSQKIFKDFYKDEEIDKSILDKKNKEKKNEINNPESYENIKKEFEENHFKILNPSGFCIIDKDDMNGIGYDIRFLDQKTLKNNYNNKYYLNLENNKKEKFIQKWLDDENIKTYKNLTFLPKIENENNIIYNPKTSFNTFINYRIENIEKDISYNNIKFEDTLIYKHLDILSGNKKENLDYLLKFLSKKIKHPLNTYKRTALIIKSDQGVGKDTLKILIDNIIGYKYTIAAKADKFFKDFNSCLNEKIFCFVNELSISQSIDYKEIMKDLITCERLNIENKGKDLRENIRATSCFIFFTNNDNPINIDTTERRYAIFESNNKYAKNQEYFNNLYKEIYNDQYVKIFYEYLMSLDVKDFDFETKIPNTEIYRDIISNNIPIVAKFLEDLIIKNIKINKTLKIDNIFELFCQYIKDNKFKFELNITNFGLQLKKYLDNGITKKRISSGFIYNVDFNTLKQHLIDKKYMINDDLFEEEVEEDDNKKIVNKINVLDM